MPFNPESALLQKGQNFLALLISFWDFMPKFFFQNHPIVFLERHKPWLNYTQYTIGLENSFDLANCFFVHEPMKSNKRSYTIKFIVLKWQLFCISLYIFYIKFWTESCNF